MFPHDISGDHGAFVVVGVQLAEQIDQGLVLRLSDKVYVHWAPRGCHFEG
jgi:hypothetical protein